MAKGHALLVCLAGAQSPDTNFFLQEETALRDEPFFDNGNDNGVSFLPDSGHRLDLPANLLASDFDCLLRERLGDQRGLLSRDPRDRHTASFHQLFGYCDFFAKQGNDNFVVLATRHRVGAFECLQVLEAPVRIAHGVELIARGAAMRGAACL